MRNELFIRKLSERLPIILVLILAILFLFPFYWMIVGAFTPSSRLFDVTLEKLLPTTVTLYNFEKLITENQISRWFLNSLIASSATTAVVVLFNTMAGYALAKKKFFGSKVIFSLFVGTLMLPRQVLIVPMYITMRDLGLIGNFMSIILPAMAWPLGIFLMRQFMYTIPNDIIESATIDGCGEMRIFISIVLPLAKPGIGALTILTFMSVWNDYLWQLVIISKKTLVTLPIGIASLQSGFAIDYGVAFAGATIGAVPMIIVFLMFQKYFTNGLTLGAVKE
jgi:multiple sugar transport system permease protein